MLPVMLLLISCGKDDPTPEPEPAVTNCKILESVNPANGSTSTYHYDAQGRLIKLDWTYPNTTSGAEYRGLEYDASGKLIKNVWSIPYMNLYYHLLYDYNSAGQVVKLSINRKNAEGNFVPASYYIFEYANPQELRQMRLYWITANGDVLQKTDDFFYENGLMKRVETKAKNEQDNRVVTIEYDNKKKPSYGFQAVFLMEYGFPFKHNITKYTTTDSKGQVIPGESYEATYTYNPQDYPITATYKHQDNRTYGYTSTYSCK